MTSRDAERFAYNDFISSDLDSGDIYIEFEFLDNLKGTIIDISLKGVGFEVTGISSENAEILSKEKDYFLKIHAGEEFFLAGVQNRWYVLDTSQGSLVYKGGVELQILSLEDSVKLNELISALRNGSR